MSMEDIIRKTKAFVEERDWGKYHTPKNLIVGVSVEAGELLSLVEWMSEEDVRKALEHPDFRKAVKEEIADVLIELVNLCNVLGIDPVQAFHEKFNNTLERFPVHKAKTFDPVEWKLKKLSKKKPVHL